MKYKYKKFLKAAYIDYEEDYCSNAVLRSSRPPLSEILAPATFEITLSPGEGYYWTTFYTSMANYLAPEGVTVYKGHLEGGSITYSTVDDRIINKRQGVVIRSSTNTITLTKTYSRSSDDYSDNSLIGTDYLITNPGHAYALGYKDSDGVAFYRLSSTGKIKANKAYLIIEDIYLTQWRLVGNSEVHTDEYLTQWKVEGNSQIQQYLTQWKVEGNSVVSNPSADLPQGYKKCKYLEFHGTEYINSGVLIKNDIGLSLDLSTTTQSKCIIGARNNSLYGVLMGYYSFSGASENYKMYFSYGEKSNNYVVQTNVCDGLLHHIVLDSQQAKIDNENVVINRGNEFPQMPIFIGTWNNYNGTPDDRLFEGKIYSIRLYDSNGNLFNGIPCLDNNNVPCLYDTVSQTAFYNDGTGTFGYELEQPTILSCGDLGQDGKYHVKISNGVDVFDITLDEPLRKVNDVADNIEFANGVATVTRNLSMVDIGDLTCTPRPDQKDGLFIISLPDRKYYRQSGVLCTIYKQVSSVVAITAARNLQDKECCYFFLANNYSYVDRLFAYDTYYIGATGAQIEAGLRGQKIIYELATPTIEVISAPQIAVSSTNTYSSANTTPYSAFTYANPLIYSCGDYSDVDGKYHVKISNGVTIYDIALTEPLRKVNDVADSIEFINGVATLTRKIAKAIWNDLDVKYGAVGANNYMRFYTSSLKNVIYVPSGWQERVLCCMSADFVQDAAPVNLTDSVDQCMCVERYTESSAYIFLRDTSVNSPTEFKKKYGTHDFLYRLKTPTTETIQVSPFPISPTDTYTSANDTPYSAFEYKKNVEIWSCGEYSEVDNKWHILVQPQGGSIVDIALDEPLRKVNNVADTIEFANGMATLTRPLKSILIGNSTVVKSSTNTPNVYRWALKVGAKIFTANILNTKYTLNRKTKDCEEGINIDSGGDINIFNSAYTSADDGQAFKAANADVEIIYELATPTTETIQVPQIQEADSYTCVISQDGKAVEWSSFETE